MTITTDHDFVIGCLQGQIVGQEIPDQISQIQFSITKQNIIRKYYQIFSILNLMQNCFSFHEKSDIYVTRKSV